MKFEVGRDTLGKKTSLQAVLYLFTNARSIWPDGTPMSVQDATKRLEKNQSVSNAFNRFGWPKDNRAKQAYVRRFFKWLTLPARTQAHYPTVILAVSDSIALRQCLWIDFVFGTAEAQEALDGLYPQVVNATPGAFALSTANANLFNQWIGRPKDDTSRVAFSGWLKDAGIAFDDPQQRGREHSVIVALHDARYISPEALCYGLWLEFEPSGIRYSTVIPLSKIADSLTAKALMIKPQSVPALVHSIAALGYATVDANTISIDLPSFAASLRRNRPFPSQSWIEDRSPEDPLSMTALEELSNFPQDDVFADQGVPFDTTEGGEEEQVKRRKRNKAFQDRVSAAYKHTCCISGMSFRSPVRAAWYGDAAHIIPHDGRDRQGQKVYGHSVVTNGLFLSKFHHWCFDQGWFTLRPVRRANSIIAYKIEVATVAFDDSFKAEGAHLRKLRNTKLNPAWLPDDPEKWPSAQALQWHADNVFAG